MKSRAREMLDDVNQKIHFADEDIVHASQRLTRCQNAANLLREERTYWERIVRMENEGKFP